MSLTVLVVGLVITLLVAVLQQANAKAERQLVFNAAANRVQQNLKDTVDGRVQEFRSGINFIAATHPGPLDEYRDFFSRELDMVIAFDPGVLLIEVLPESELDDLRAREAALGNDFEIALLPAPTEQRAIITRLVRPATVFDRQLLGFDGTLFQAQLIPGEFGDDGFELFVLDSIALSSLVGEVGPVDPKFEEFRDYTTFLVGEVVNREGELIGYAVKFQTVALLLESVTAQDLQGLSLEMYVDGINEPVAARRSANAPEVEDSPLVDTREVVTASLTWQVKVWADEGYGPSTGLFVDEIEVWLAGLTISILAYATSIRRSHQRHRLRTAKFELAHARTLAQTDELTGLLNRHGLIDAARQNGAETAATVFFIDLDGFKAVNDTEGHARGDEVLRAVATTLRSVFRPSDLVGRIGGDEFVVFTGSDATDVYIEAVSTRITDAVSQVDDRVTCSLGVASRIRGQNTDVKDLLRAADTAMYEAKRSGGNRYAVKNPA